MDRCCHCRAAGQALDAQRLVKKQAEACKAPGRNPIGENLA
jgi:hypothetical protein